MQMTQTTADQPRPRDPRTSRVLAAYFGVYRALGWGYLESVYRRSMVVGLRRLGATVDEEVNLEVRYLGDVVGEFLKATKLEVGMLLNFGPNPSYQRIVFSKERKEPQPLRIGC
jgi:hypothetical protein